MGLGLRYEARLASAVVPDLRPSAPHLQFWARGGRGDLLGGSRLDGRAPSWAS